MGWFRFVATTGGRTVAALRFGLIFIVSAIVPRQESTWVFTCTSTDGRFADNTKYLYLYCAQNEDIRAIWVSESDDIVNDLRKHGYEAYNSDSIRGKVALLRASVACITYQPAYEQFLAGATVVDLRHGNSLKTMKRDDPTAKSKDIFEHLKKRVWAPLFGVSYVMVTNVGKPFEVVKSARGLSWDETIIAPYPRLDPFFVDVKDAEIRTNTAQLEDVRARAENTDFVVYAPTWRRAGGYVNGSPLAEVQPDFKQVDQVLDDYECQLLITPHPAEPLDIQYEQYDNIDQLAEGDDIYPFLAYCEVLITDYSSLLYDFSVTNRPMLFYAPDIDEYERTRGLYFEYREHVPGPISESTEELTAHLRTVLNGEDDYNKERVALKQEYYDGLTERPSKQAFQQIVTAVEN